MSHQIKVLFMSVVFIALAACQRSEASEVLEFKTFLDIGVCEKLPDGTTDCPFNRFEPQATKIELAYVGGNVFMGDLTIEKEVRGVRFQVYIFAEKVATEPLPYSLVFILSSKIADDPATFKQDVVGAVMLRDITELNTISYFGNTLNVGNLSLTPNFIIGPNGRNTPTTRASSSSIGYHHERDPVSAKLTTRL